MNRSIGEILREMRAKKGLLLREVAASLRMDTALLSKFERDERKPNKDQVMAFAKFYDLKPDELLIAWLSDKIAIELGNEEVAIKAVQIAEKKIKQHQRKR